MKSIETLKEEVAKRSRQGLGRRQSQRPALLWCILVLAALMVPTSKGWGEMCGGRGMGGIDRWVGDLLGLCIKRDPETNLTNSQL